MSNEPLKLKELATKTVTIETSFRLFKTILQN